MRNVLQVCGSWDRATGKRSDTQHQHRSQDIYDNWRLFSHDVHARLKLIRCECWCSSLYHYPYLFMFTVSIRLRVLPVPFGSTKEVVSMLDIPFHRTIWNICSPALHLLPSPAPDRTCVLLKRTAERIGREIPEAKFTNSQHPQPNEMRALSYAALGSGRLKKETAWSDVTQYATTEVLIASSPKRPKHYTSSCGPMVVAGLCQIAGLFSHPHGPSRRPKWHPRLGNVLHCPAGGRRVHAVSSPLRAGQYRWENYRNIVLLLMRLQWAHR